MPAYPAPSFPQPTGPGRSRVPAWMWVLGSLLVVAVVAVWGLAALRDGGPIPTPGPGPTAQPTAAPTADDRGQPNTSADGQFTGTYLVEQLNTALADTDRETFFRYVDGDALAPLNLWWDNMEVLGWTEGAFSLVPNQDHAYSADSVEQAVTLGAVTAGSPAIPADSDHPDAGKSYAPSNFYVATIHVTDDGESGVLTGWAPRSTSAPWDLAPLYAVISEHAVMAGYADEKALVDSVAGVVEESAAWVISTYEDETGVANAQRFLTFVTEDASRFNQWFLEGAQNQGWVSDRAGTMFPQSRPFASPGIAPDIATGGYDTTAGGVLTIGPNGLLYGLADTQDTITHEFIHAIHTTNVPRAGYPGSPVMEGWATYNESLFQSDGRFASRYSLTGRTLRGCVDSQFDGDFPTQEDFVAVETVDCAYSLSSTVYAFADSLGIDVYELADVALETGDDLPDAALEIGDTPIDEAGWAEWVQSTFG